MLTDRGRLSPPAPQPSYRYPVTAMEQMPERRGWRQFLRTHRLICCVLVAAVAVRVVVLIAYPPAFWFPDSIPYVQSAISVLPFFFRPGGYSVMLLALEPLHSVQLVTIVQDLMGLAIGVEVYALLRRWRVPAWGATLAAIPALLSVYQIQLEHFVLSDTLFGLVTMSIVVLIQWRSRPDLWLCAAVGGLVGFDALVRSQGTFLLIPFFLYLLVRRLGFRRLAASALVMGIAFATPVVVYAWWFEKTNHVFELTTSTGAVLYAKVADFANCSVIKPPADERWLCISTPVSQRPDLSWYLFLTTAPYDPPPGRYVQESPLYTGPVYDFSPKGSHLEENFALRAVEAQPVDYLKVVWRSFVQTFLPRGLTNGTSVYYMFPAHVPESVRHLAIRSDADPSAAVDYNGGSDPSTHVNQPFASLSRFYQAHFALPPPLLGVIVVAGLAGIGLGWRRRGGSALLPWLTGFVLIVTPVATADFDSRYVVPAVPLFCVAATIGIAEAVRDLGLPGARRAGIGRAMSSAEFRESGLRGTVRPRQTALWRPDSGNAYSQDAYWRDSTPGAKHRRPGGHRRAP